MANYWKRFRDRTTIHVPRRAVLTYPITRPANATDFASEPDSLERVLASARWPQMIEGTAVSPNVSRAKMPRVKAQMGSADKSSSGRDNTRGGILPPGSIIVRRRRPGAADLQAKIAREIPGTACGEFVT